MAQEDRVAFNEIMNKGTLAQKRIAMRGLASQHREAVGKPANLMDTTKSSASTGYETKAEWLRDVGNPQYKRDPVFRAEVDKKLRVSKGW